MFVSGRVCPFLWVWNITFSRYSCFQMMGQILENSYPMESSKRLPLKPNKKTTLPSHFFAAENCQTILYQWLATSVFLFLYKQNPTDQRLFFPIPDKGKTQKKSPPGVVENLAAGVQRSWTMFFSFQVLLFAQEICEILHFFCRYKFYKYILFQRHLKQQNYTYIKWWLIWRTRNWDEFGHQESCLPPGQTWRLRLPETDFTTHLNGAFKRWNLWAPSVENE